MVEKIKDSVLIMFLVLICPWVLELFRFPVETHHKVGFALFGLAGVIVIWQKLNDMDALEQVLDAKKVGVGKIERVK